MVFQPSFCVSLRTRLRKTDTHCAQGYAVYVKGSDPRSTQIAVRSRTEADLRKRALSAAYGGSLQWRKFSILVDPKQISVVSKGEKHLLPCATFSWFGWP